MNFWICQALAQAGHEVHVVTNGTEVEAQYRTVDGKVAPDLSNSPLEGLHDNLTVHYTNELAHYAYIPFANPFVSKLSSIAIDVIRKYGCDIIFGHYFEPYGVAAYMASKATGVPFGLQHAGSDVGRLLQSPELRTVYSEIINSADYIFASNSTRRRFIQEGVSPDRIYALPRSTYADRLYTPDATPLDMDAHVAKARAELKGTDYLALLDRFPVSNYRRERPTVGIYGKTGEAKGSFDLIDSLKLLRDKGVDFNFLALTNSGKKSLSAFLQRVEDAGLADRLVWLPFVPHWKVPEFIKLCDTVAFLERDFSIPIHQPAVAMEVLLCGTCLIVSDEIAAKQRFKADLRDGENILVVNPKDIAALAAKIELVIKDRALGERIGANGRAVMLQHAAPADTLTQALSLKFEEIYSTILEQKDEQKMIEFQAFLTRLYTDDVFRKLNSISPDAAESFFKLSDEEKTLLRALEARAIDDFASSLKTKCRQRHFGILPLTIKLLGKERANEFFERFYSIARPYPGETKLALAGKFGQFIEDAILAAGLGGEPVAELIRFERKFVELSLKTGPADDFSGINLRVPPVLEIGPGAIIHLNDSVYIDKYAYDIPALVEQLRADAESPAAVARATNVVFIVAPNEAVPKVLKVNEASVQLLKLASSKITLADLTDKFGIVLGKPAQQKDVIEATMFFAKSGMLRVEHAPAA